MLRQPESPSAPAAHATARVRKERRWKVGFKVLGLRSLVFGLRSLIFDPKPQDLRPKTQDLIPPARDWIRRHRPRWIVFQLFRNSARPPPVVFHEHERVAAAAAA